VRMRSEAGAVTDVEHKVISMGVAAGVEHEVTSMGRQQARSTKLHPWASSRRGAHVSSMGRQQTWSTGEAKHKAV
jgi:hypothetical protein